MSLLEEGRHARAYPTVSMPRGSSRRIVLLCDDATEELCDLSRNTEGHAKQIGRAAALIGIIRRIAGGLLS